MIDRMDLIREAYDLTVEQNRQGTDPLDAVPDSLKNSAQFKEFMRELGPEQTGSSAPENREFLDPQPGMKFLDAGCSANLANYRLDRWPSLYYGVDISPALIRAMRSFAEHNNIAVGALEVTELLRLPFDDSFFDIAAVIGVLEYASLDYCESALRELGRVLKTGSRMVVDIPNLDHPHIDTMFALERYLGRPNMPKARADFERVLAPLFTTLRTDDSCVMLKYFVETHN